MTGRCISAAVALLLAGAATGVAQDHTPTPYAPDEFPGWMSDVWRAEAIFVGVFPLSLFVTLEVYDSYRYVSNNFAPNYAPWPFGSGTAVTYSPSETLWLAASTISLSLTVAGIDFILRHMSASASASP